jgi:hypothetical protein
MGRSGTSWLAEFLGRCGVFLDRVNWAHEHELGRLINDTALAREFGARRGLPYGKLPEAEIVLGEYWSDLAQSFAGYMRLRATEEGAADWAFKDPRTTVLQRIWLPLFDAVVAIFRHPEAVVESYVGQGWVRGLRRRRLALAYWKRFNRSLLAVREACSPAKPFLLLDFDADLATQGRALCHALALGETEAALSLYDPARKHYDAAQRVRDSEAAVIYEQLRGAAILAR